MCTHFSYESTHQGISLDLKLEFSNVSKSMKCEQNWNHHIENFHLTLENIEKVNIYYIYLYKRRIFFILEWKTLGLVRDLNPGPLAPKARIMPLDQRATDISANAKFVYKAIWPSFTFFVS